MAAYPNKGNGMFEIHVKLIKLNLIYLVNTKICKLSQFIDIFQLI